MAASRTAPPVVLPRGLIFLSSVWLVTSWVIALGLRTPVQPSSATFTPGVRLMLLCVTIGLMIGWPLLRLSQSAPPYPLRQTLLDLMVLLGLVQVVIWPLRLITTWTPLRTAALDATIAGWTMLAGAVVAAAITSSKAGPRLLAMTVVIAMCLLGPALGWLGLLTGIDAMALIELSPLLTVRSLSEAGGVNPSSSQWQWIALLWVAVAATWTALGASAALAGISRASHSMPEANSTGECADR